MKRISSLITCLVMLALVAGTTLARAQRQRPAGSYSLSWWTVDGGGGTSTSAGSGYSLSGTIGQPDTGSVASGGGYTQAGGFWHGGAVAPVGVKVYLPLVVR